MATHYNINGFLQRHSGGFPGDLSLGIPFFSQELSDTVGKARRYAIVAGEGSLRNILDVDLFLWKETRIRQLMSSPGAPSAGPSTPPSYSLGPSTPPSYSSRPSTPPNYSS
nr:hypothetical protein [Tanacetum cinerariifolium]